MKRVQRHKCAAFVGALTKRIGEWYGVKPSARICVSSHVQQDKENRNCS